MEPNNNNPNKNNSVFDNCIESLKIYKQIVDLIYYTEMITLKFPRFEKWGIVAKLKNETYDAAKNVISAYKAYEISEKIKYLNLLDGDLKMIKILVRVCRKRNYINSKNYRAWSRKLFIIGNLLGGWINSCRNRSKNVLMKN